MPQYRPADLPDLRPERLQKLIERFMTAPNLLFLNMFGEDNAPSDTIEWESQIGNRGMTPFAAPGSKAQMLAPTGVAKHTAKAAYWKEKIYFDEEFLNNLRQPGTYDQIETAQKRIARETQTLKNRCDRRKEWMICKMLTTGSFSYLQQGGIRIDVDYGIPDDFIFELGSTRKWNYTGDDSTVNILEDIMDIKIMLQNSNGGIPTNAYFTSEVLKEMIMAETIQTLLQKSAYGEGDLFARPVQVLGSLLDIPNMVLYDEQYQIRAWLTANVVGDSTTTIYVDEASDFEVGDTLRFVDVSSSTWEEETISAVNVDAGTITVAAAPSISFRAREDFVYTTRKFIPPDRFVLLAKEVEGSTTAEFLNAPFGLNRTYGMFVDSKDEWDPDGTMVRVQNKGLPVLYNTDCVISMKVI